MSEYKRQHTVTEGYLRGFASDGTPNTLWRYSKNDGSCERSNVENATVKFYAYSFRDADGEWNHEVEKLFGRIESVALQALRKVIAFEELTLTERQDFALFVGTILRRPAALLEQFEKALSNKGHAFTRRKGSDGTCLFSNGVPNACYREESSVVGKELA